MEEAYLRRIRPDPTPSPTGSSADAMAGAGVGAVEVVCRKGRSCGGGRGRGAGGVGVARRPGPMKTPAAGETTACRPMVHGQGRRTRTQRHRGEERQQLIGGGTSNATAAGSPRIHDNCGWIRWIRFRCHAMAGSATHGRQQSLLAEMEPWRKSYRRWERKPRRRGGVRNGACRSEHRTASGGEKVE